jgi:hypothetical protein
MEANSFHRSRLSILLFYCMMETFFLAGENIFLCHAKFHEMVKYINYKYATIFIYIWWKWSQLIPSRFMDHENGSSLTNFWKLEKRMEENLHTLANGGSNQFLLKVYVCFHRRQMWIVCSNKIMGRYMSCST